MLDVMTSGRRVLPRSGAEIIEHSPVLYDYDPRRPVGAEVESPDGKKYRGVALWGSDNCAPNRLIKAAKGTPLLSAAMEFKSLLLAGDRVVPVRRHLDNGRWKDEPCYDYPEVNDFLHDSDINGFIMEQALDMVVLGNVFAEVVLDRQRSRIVELNHKEAAFSRWELADPECGRVEHHFYSARWGRGGALPDDTSVTECLPLRRQEQTLKYWMGLEADPTGQELERPGTWRYIVPTISPSLGRPYYSHPWWYSLIESGWLEFAQNIPRYKSTLLGNSTVIRYHVELHPDFWRRYYEQLGITTEEEKRQARAAWLTAIDEFLSDPNNTGRAFLSEKVQMGTELQSLVTIEAMKNDIKGGELIADLEETSNILAYGMGVHPSLIGASPGKNKSINGTEARELFIIKQAILQPLRQQLLRPLYLVKAINGWPEDVHFTIMNLELTTLDRGTGAVKSISQPAID